MNPGRARHGNQRGWTLIELAVGLAIAALLAVVLVRTLSASREATEAQPVGAQLALAQDALQGYAQVHARLPSADTDGDGLQDTGSSSGWLPVRTLSLPSRLRLRYRVDNALTAAPTDLYRPAWPDTTADEAGAGHTGNLSAASRINGLDFCARLAQRVRAPTNLSGLGMPAAFAVTSAGPVGHDQSPDAATTLPGSGNAANSPDPTLATGLGELAARLACPDRVSRLQGAAREALMGADMIRLAQVYLDFRKLAEEQAELTKLNAATSVAFGTFDLAYGAAELALAASELAGDGGFLAAVEVGVATLEMANAVAALVFAGLDLHSAIEGMTEAAQDTANADAHLARMRALADRTRQHVLDLDAAGLNP